MNFISRGTIIKTKILGRGPIMNDRISIRGLITQFDHLKLKLAMQGILVGIASGFMVVFYRMILEKAEHIRQLITLNQPLWMIGGWFILLVSLPFSWDGS